MFTEHSPFLKEGVPPRKKVAIGIALVATFMCALQATAMLCGFRGPLERLISDYVGTPAGFTVPWAALVVALVAAARGPTPADRMLMALLFGTTGTAVLVLLAAAGGGTPLVDVALVLALLAAIGGIAFAKRAWQGEEGGDA